MSQKLLQNNFRANTFLLLTVFLAFLMTTGCAVEAAKNRAEKRNQKTEIVTENSQQTSKIEIQPNSPADTVRAFYKHLREKKFREAIFLTNLRPAIEGLTESELKDLEVDFASLAQQVPAEVEINGEIISGAKAAVTAKLPDGATNQLQMQQIKLRRDENNVWIIMTVDEQSEAVIKKEGRNYFFNLRIETHHAEAREMFDRIMKAETVYAMQNGGAFADMETLIAKNFLAQDIVSGAAGGYKYKIALSADKKQYSASAEPVVYGKTGKLSFRLNQADIKQAPKLLEKDNKGQPLKN